MTERESSRRAAFERVRSFLSFGKVEKPHYANLRKGQERRDARREYERALRFQQRRRRWVVGGGVSAVALATAGVTLGPRAWDALSQRGETKEVFTGEIEETKQYLGTWEAEVARNPNAVETYFPKIRDLAIAYFTNRMSFYIGQDVSIRIKDVKDRSISLKYETLATAAACQVRYAVVSDGSIANTVQPHGSRLVFVSV